MEGTSPAVSLKMPQNRHKKPMWYPEMGKKTAAKYPKKIKCGIGL